MTLIASGTGYIIIKFIYILLLCSYMKPFTAILFLGGNILLDRAEKLKEEIASGEVDETKAVGMF